MILYIPYALEKTKEVNKDFVSMVFLMKKQKAMVFGTFDILHAGHLNFFEQAKELAEKLVVLVALDENVKNTKGSLPLHAQKERLEKVMQQKIVDKAVLGKKTDFLQTIAEEKPEIILLGYDQKWNEKELEQKIAGLGLKVEVKRAKAFQPNKFKSSKIRRKMKI
jgi:FAD synthetase